MSDEGIRQPRVLITDDLLCTSHFRNCAILLFVLSVLNSVSVRVVTDPIECDDGHTKAIFEADGLGCSSTDDEDIPRPLPLGSTSVSMNITYYHCASGNAWNRSSAADGTSGDCLLCTDVVEGSVKVSICVALYCYSGVVVGIYQGVSSRTGGAFSPKVYRRF